MNRQVTDLEASVSFWKAEALAMTALLRQCAPLIPKEYLGVRARVAIALDSQNDTKGESNEI
jgi:hypothetical protein